MLQFMHVRLNDVGAVACHSEPVPVAHRSVLPLGSAQTSLTARLVLQMLQRLASSMPRAQPHVD